MKKFRQNQSFKSETYVKHINFPKDLRYALIDARDSTKTAMKLERSPGAHHKAGKAWDKVAFLTKDKPEHKEVHDNAVQCAELEYKKMDALDSVYRR